MRLNILHSRREAGDTIIEVLIVLAILSMSFGISYATANKGLQKSRTAQEHSQALGIGNAQIESLRALTGKKFTIGGSQQTIFTPANQPFCISSSQQKVPISDTISEANFNSSTYPADCKNNNGLYYTSIVYDGSTFKATVRWQGLGTSGPQKEDLAYRISDITLLTSRFDVPGQGPKISDPVPDITPVDYNGGNYALCVGTNNNYNPSDPYDFCFPNTASATGPVYMRRNADVYYYINTLKKGPAKLKITYRQYQGAGTLPPAGYGNFNLNLRVTGSNANEFFFRTTDPATTLYLPIESNAAAYSEHTYSTDFNMPYDYGFWIGLAWTNNGTVSDPDLQIDKIEITQ